MKDNKNTCEDCGSTNTYISGFLYNIVRVCEDCNHEEHIPSEDSIKILLDTIPSL